MGKTRQFCTFLLDGDLLRLSVDEVREILRHQEMTPTRRAAAGRGPDQPARSDRSAIDLRRCLGAGARRGAARDIVVAPTRP
jgi:hypothetical protein